MRLSLHDTIALMAQQPNDDWARWQLLELHRKALRLHAGKALASAQTMNRDDMEQEAIIGTLTLLKSWKPASGCTFYSWLYTWLPHTLRRVKDASDYVVRIPAAAGVKDRRNGNQAIPFSTSIYAPALDDGEEVLRHEVEESALPQRDYEQIDLEMKLQQLIDTLPTRQREVLMATMYGGATREELAAKYSCTHQAVSAAYKQGIKRLRSMAESLQ